MTFLSPEAGGEGGPFSGVWEFGGLGFGGLGSSVWGFRVKGLGVHFLEFRRLRGCTGGSYGQST